MQGISNNWLEKFEEKIYKIKYWNNTHKIFKYLF